MRIALGADHGGFGLKEHIAAMLRREGYEILDQGAFRLEADDDYPDHALAVADAIRSGAAERGILVCGSGVGACVAANKVPGIRAALAHDTYSAHQGVEDDDLNVLCLGARVVGPELACELVLTFLRARFTEAERHRRRLRKVEAIENRCAHRQELTK